MSEIRAALRFCTARVRILIGAVALIVLAGCDSTAQINEARPVDSAVYEPWSALLDMYAEGEGRVALEAEYANRLRARALSCSGGYEPWFFSSRETVRASLTDSACFEKSDKDLAAWISEESLKKLASLPALRPIPEEIPELIATSSQFASALFASDAGVAAIGGYGQATEIVDVASGDTIFQEQGRKQNSNLVSISPNGRLYAVRDAESSGVVVRDSTNGRMLASYPGVERMNWLESDLAITQDSSGQVTALDLSTGRKSIVKGVTGGNFVPVKSGKSSSYVALNGPSLVEIQVRRDSEAVTAKLVREIPINTRGSYPRGEAAVNRGSVLLSVGGDLVVVDLSSSSRRVVSVAPFGVLAMLPLPAPDRYLLTMRSPQSRTADLTYVVFLADEERFAIPTDPIFENPGSWGLQSFTFIPSLNRLAARSAKSLKLIDEVAFGPKLTAQALVALYAGEDASVASTDAALVTVPGSSGSQSTRGVGTLPQLAAGAEIQAVGVYESSTVNRGFGETKPGRVRVAVARGNKPVILVLSSYESVVWDVTVAGAGQDVKAVLLGGYKDSTVTGVGDARVIRLGRVYAYERSSSEYTQLDQEVRRWTGKSIDLFQGTYKGSLFMVGLK